MKKILITALFTLATLTAGSIKADAAAEKMSEKNLYPQTFIVYEVDREFDIVYLMTFSGFEYEWEGVEDWHAGDIASALMNDNGTPKITDDEIIKLHYAGENIYDMDF